MFVLLVPRLLVHCTFANTCLAIAVLSSTRHNANNFGRLFEYVMSKKGDMAPLVAVVCWAVRRARMS